MLQPPTNTVNINDWLNSEDGPIFLPQIDYNLQTEGSEGQQLNIVLMPPIKDNRELLSI